MNTILICSNCTSPSFIFMITLNREITGHQLVGNTEVDVVKGGTVNASIFINV